MIPRPRSLYLAFEVFPRAKGSTSHMAAMTRALAERYGPVWLLCLGVGDMPAVQVEGDIVIHRFKLYHPNLLKRAAGFANFVAERMAQAGGGVELMIFRDPWAGAPGLGRGPGAGVGLGGHARHSGVLP
jgi:hypothetical protein